MMDGLQFKICLYMSHVHVIKADSRSAQIHSGNTTQFTGYNAAPGQVPAPGRGQSTGPVKTSTACSPVDGQLE